MVGGGGGWVDEEGLKRWKVEAERGCGVEVEGGVLVKDDAGGE